MSEYSSISSRRIKNRFLTRVVYFFPIQLLLLHFKRNHILLFFWLLLFLYITQTMGHYSFDVKKLAIDFLTCSAHKIHGPKGIGFLYVKKGLPISPLITGGSQERSHRGGTENIYGIIGLGKAMDLSYSDLENHQKYVQGLKLKMMKEIQSMDKRISFNGETDPNKSLYTVLNVSFPEDICNSMLLFSLDIHGIAASGGSACSSGSNKGSHVLAELPNQENKQAVRFSFSRFTTNEEIEYTLEKIRAIIKNE